MYSKFSSLRQVYQLVTSLLRAGGWNRPQKVTGDKPPISCLVSESGTQEVVDLICLLEQGVYS